MQNNNQDFQSQLLRFGLDLTFLIPGFFGALFLSLKKKKQKLSKTITCIIGGMLCANFMTPIILNFAPESLQEKGKYGVAFMMGYIGLNGLEHLIDFGMTYLENKFGKRTVDK